MRDDETSIADWDRVSVHTPEPVDNPPAFAAGVEFPEEDGRRRRGVFLYGEGPDNALRYEWRPYLSHLAGPTVVSAALVRALLERSARCIRACPCGRRFGRLPAPEGKRSDGEKCFQAGSMKNSPRDAGAERDGTRTSARHRRRTPSGRWDTTGLARPRNGNRCSTTATSAARLSCTRDSPPVSRPATAAIHAGAARDAVVPEQTDHPSSDAKAALPVGVLRRKKTAVPVSPDFKRRPASGFPRLVLVAGSCRGT